MNQEREWWQWMSKASLTWNLEWLRGDRLHNNQLCDFPPETKTNLIKAIEQALATGDYRKD